MGRGKMYAVYPVSGRHLGRRFEALPNRATVHEGGTTSDGRDVRIIGTLRDENKYSMAMLRRKCTSELFSEGITHVCR